MIRKQDILDRAAEWQLRPEVVEKDYVLGWLLAALAGLPVGQLWIFKGGTCVKKCYFETYRFSEDLDFSLRPDAPYSQDALTDDLRAIVSRAAELSGLEFSTNLIDVRPRRNQQGQETFEGRVAYRGPLAYPGRPKIRFDLTRHEPILDAAASRRVLHPYPDELPADALVSAYSFHELLAEKVRALRERSRPRDLYDVVHLLENTPALMNFVDVHALFDRKCTGKGIAVPSNAELTAAVTVDAELRAEWANMLAHQLPALPDLDVFLGKLPGLLTWLDAPSAPPIESRLPFVPAQAAHRPIAAPGIRYWGANSPVESIRFAASNRLLVEFDYHGVHRHVEPYSIRQPRTGNVLLYGWELAAGHIKAFKIDEMFNVRATGAGFTPKYRVEI
jgi:predicted nucleotidyltransferase component of viral defense system